MSGGPPSDPASRLLRLLGGKWVAAALSAAAELGVVDALLEAPASAGELAARIEAEPAMLGRLLGVLAAEGLVIADPRTGVFSVTELGAPLRKGALGELASFSGAPFAWDPWSRLAEGIRRGEAPFTQRHGAALFDYLDAHPEDAAVYHHAVDSFTRLEAAALAEAYDLSGAHRIVDVGGGRGAMLAELLRRHPALRGVLFDREAAARVAEEAFKEAGLSERAELVVGDFFESVPEGADVYVVKHVLHNWADDEATRLLSNVAAAMREGGRVLVVEGAMLPLGYPDQTRLLDLEMLTLLGHGRERSKPELRALFARSGLRLVSSHPLVGPARLWVTERAR